MNIKKHISIITPTFIAVFLLSGCASFQPRLGISVDEWQSECMVHNWTAGQRVKAEGNKEVYYCDNIYVFHYFEDGKLVKIGQGDLSKEQIELYIK